LQGLLQASLAVLQMVPCNTYAYKPFNTSSCINSTTPVLLLSQLIIASTQPDTIHFEIIRPAY